MLHEFLAANRAELIARCDATLLDQVTEALRLGVPAQSAQPGSLSIAQIVEDHGRVREAIIGQAVALSAEELQSLHSCIDQAIATAVTDFAKLREDEATERLGRLAHELRNHLNSALLCHEMLKMGTVDITSRTGAVLGRSLNGLRNVIDRELADVRLATGIYQRETIGVLQLIEDIEVPASMEARARGLEFSVVRPDKDVSIAADRQILETVVANLLQNAFKFTRPHGHIVLRTVATADRVLIEIEDQCGGLPPGKVDELFLPFAQRPKQRKGLGLGLEICARGVRLNNGLIRVVDQPGAGCVFTVDLPRAGSA